MFVANPALAYDERFQRGDHAYVCMKSSKRPRVVVVADPGTANTFVQVVTRFQLGSALTGFTTYYEGNQYWLPSEAIVSDKSYCQGSGSSNRQPAHRTTAHIEVLPDRFNAKRKFLGQEINIQVKQYRVTCSNGVIKTVYRDLEEIWRFTTHDLANNDIGFQGAAPSVFARKYCGLWDK